MNNSAKYYIHIFSLVLAMLLSNIAFAQLDIFTTPEDFTEKTDSIEISKPIELSNINNEIEYTDNLITQFSLSQDQIEENLKFKKDIDTLHVFIVQQGEEFYGFDGTKLSHYFLTNTKYTWERYYGELRDYQLNIQEVIRKSQASQNKFNNNINKWNKNLPKLKASLSKPILDRITNNTNTSKEIIKKYDNSLKLLLETESEIIDDITYIERLIATTNRFIEIKRNNILTKTEPSIFTLDYIGSYQGTFIGRLSDAYYENTKTFSYFIGKIGENLGSYLFLLALLSLGLHSIRKKYIKLGYNESNAGYNVVQRIIISKIHYIIIAFALIIWTIIIPFTPLIITKSIYLIVLLLMLIIMADFYSKSSIRIIVIVVTILLLNNLEIFAWYYGNFGRLYLLLESGIAIFLVGPYIKSALSKDVQKKDNTYSLTYYMVKYSPVLGILLSIAFIANIIGTVNLAIYILNFTAHFTAITIISFSFTKILKSLLIASIDVLNPKYPDLVNHYGESIHKKGSRIINIGVAIAWSVAILHVSEIFSYFNSHFTDILTSGISIGSISFTFGNLLLFFGILYISFSINSFIKNILEREILARKKMKRGYAAAISLTSRITVLFLGFTIALSASGIDMTKISIIAGALSVGIGFGLQNVVGNFVSGLILIYERPLQEGDTVEVGNLLGKVTNIGARASNVITYDGAEVVVPNNNLVSNELINWTLSDNKKRIETNVGVTYGTDPSKVLELLLEACQNHPKILPNPAPMSLFMGFGDSSLDFKVLFWVNFEDGWKTRSDINVAIYKVLNDNNIEIPFPQVDLHVKADSTLGINTK